MGTGELSGQTDRMLGGTLRSTSIPSTGRGPLMQYSYSRNAAETRISYGVSL